MKKEFWEHYTIGDDHILTDNFTGERLGFFVDPMTNELHFVPEAQYKEEIKKKNKGTLKALRKLSDPLYG